MIAVIAAFDGPLSPGIEAAPPTRQTPNRFFDRWAESTQAGPAPHELPNLSAAAAHSPDLQPALFPAEAL